MSSAVVLINIVWLFPLAWAAAWWPGFGVWLAMTALVPLLCAAIWLGAGVPEP